jgi:sulfur carrier protein ThiS
MITVKIAGGIGANWADEAAQPLVVKLETPPATVGELMFDLGIEESHTGAVLINGVPKKFRDQIEDGAEIQILPVLSGG